MYILAYRTGEIEASHELSEEAFDDHRAGLVTLIDISEQNEPKTYVDGEWFVLDAG